MKKIIVLTAIALLVSLAAMAQRNGRGVDKETRLKETMEKLEKDVNLTSVQKEKAEKIWSDFFDEMKSLKSSGQRPDRSKMQAEVSDRDKKMNRVLDKDQQPLYKKFLENQKSQRPQGGRGRR